MAIGLFQSTRPMRGATTADGYVTDYYKLSIHAPHAGRDHHSSCIMVLPSPFQSTRPMRGATLGVSRSAYQNYVSIHAPRVGRDIVIIDFLHNSASFNPRAPCGARPNSSEFCRYYYRFQSTRPVWGATSYLFNENRRSEFQSTRPVWGAT